MLSKEEMDAYLNAVAADIHTVDKSTIRVNLLVRMKYGELTEDEYEQLLGALDGN